MIQLVSGKNDYLAHNYVSNFKSGFDGSIVEIDASEVDLIQIKEDLQAQSLFNMGGNKLVIISNLSLNKQAVDYVLDNYDSISSDLLIYDQKLDKRLALYKKLKVDDMIKEFKELEDSELINWLIEEGASLGAVISRPAAALLLKRLGKDQWQLSNELNKLSHYDKNISKENIEELTTASRDETVFNMLDSLALGRKDQVLEISKELVGQGNDPIYIISMLVWFFHNVAVVKTAKSNNDYDVARQYKISPYVVGKSRKISNKLSSQELVEVFDLIVEADFQQKNVNVDKKQALSILLIEICSYFS